MSILEQLHTALCLISNQTCSKCRSAHNDCPLAKVVNYAYTQTYTSLENSYFLDKSVSVSAPQAIFATTGVESNDTVDKFLTA